MDFFGSTRFLEWFANSRRETYMNAPAPGLALPSPISSPATAPKDRFAVFSLGGVVSLVIGMVIGLIAAYLSWSCNTSLNYNLGLKIVFAILAYIFGLLYIILYIIMRYDTCAYIKKTGYY